MLRFFASVFALFLLAPLPASAEIYLYGHADIGVGFEGGELHLHFHAENDLGTYGGGTIPAGEYEAGEFMIGVPGMGDFPGSGIARPSGSQWDFLGAADDLVWFLPQSSDPNKPFLGIATEELLPGDGWDSPLTWTVNSITRIWGADSHFALWSADAFGNPQVFASTRIPTGTGNSWQQDALSHEHFNYGFTGEGIYDVSFTISGFNSTLNESFSDTGSFRFITGGAITAIPEPSSFAILAAAAASVVSYRRRRKGAGIMSDEKVVAV